MAMTPNKKKRTEICERTKMQKIKKKAQNTEKREELEQFVVGRSEGRKKKEKKTKRKMSQAIHSH